MSSTKTATLVRVADAGLTLADPADDIRGRSVIDRNGDEVGDVKSLLIDEDERRVRFLEVESGGFLGLGGRTRLLPVDAISSVDESAVHVDQTSEHLRGAPAYDPDVADEPDYYGHLYGYYGYGPYWTAGYSYPPYPYYR